MHTDRNYFTENLKKLIQKNGIKNIDLAEYLGVTKSAVSNYLSGLSVPKVDTIRKLAAFFGVSFEQLMETDIEKPALALQENDKYVCMIPLFHNQLISENVIYRNDNFLGNITAPLFLPKDSECYAVTVHDDLMKDFGIVKGSVVVFDSATAPENGDIAAVFHKNKKTIVIRRVLFDKNKITLCSNDQCNEYKITKNDCEVLVLGKVSFATFNPNTK